MALTFVLHEATRTGAPRLGGLIARELARDEEVRVIVMKDGPLTPWLRDLLGAQNLFVCRDEPFDNRVPFEDRLRLACDMLEGDPADLVYVNSLASSVFALASALGKRRTILHVHEKTADMLNLLKHAVTKIEVVRAADALVLAAADIRDDILGVFRTMPQQVVSFGVAVDADEVRAAAELPAKPPLDARGRPLIAGGRVIVGMCGHASPRKGVDVFFQTALATPQCDFLWIGGWGPDETIDNVVLEEFGRLAPANVFVTGAVDNPYPYMRMMDLFFLSSREDPNPLVIGEALVLGKPILAFSHTTGIADRLGRCGLLCHGEPNAADAIRVLKTCTPEAVRRPGFREAGAAFVAEYDVGAKMGGIADLIAQLRGGEPAHARRPEIPTGGAVRREKGRGVVELSFS